MTLKTHIPSSTHRAPGANQLGFMAEVFVDEMAIAGGWDPLEWRLKLTEGMADWQLVLKTLKEKAGFRTDLPKGEGMGIGGGRIARHHCGGLRHRHGQPPRPAQYREGPRGYGCGARHQSECCR